MDNERRDPLKVEKQLKKINKAVTKTPSLRACVTKTVSGVISFEVNAKNRAAFRFFRDHLDGEMASQVNHVYGIGGRMTVDLSEDRMVLKLYTEHNKPYDTLELTAGS